MRYSVTIGLVFATERTSEDRFDVWDIHTPVEADGPIQAVRVAMALSKNFSGRHWAVRASEPVLCGVSSLHIPEPLFALLGEVHHQSRLPVLAGTISEQKVQLLKSFEEISFPYAFIYVA